MKVNKPTRKTNNKTKREKGKLPMAAALLLALCSVALLSVLLASAGKLSARFTYPRRYETEVRAASSLYGLDPDLVFAVIRTESSFRPEVVSHAGAMGLMQIMPDTAKWIAWRQGAEYDSSRIFEPEYNISMGCYLLAYLIDYYDSDLRFAVAAYNAGSANVDSWLASEEYYDGTTLDIPFGETRNYVEKVLDSYKKYQEKDD